MPHIKLLDSNLINKIAAGEVIERPASVVKELVENSIDAGATNIKIEIKEGGIDLIEVSDNGSGIEKDEVKKAFMRHATSKLKDFDALSNILTLGFRGEALSSIASVSQVTLKTKTQDDKTGTEIEIHGGKVIRQEEVAHTKGTVFTMRNLFFNTPARRKFLKKPSTEASYVTEQVYRLALGHPYIAFKYINNDNVIFQTNSDGDLNKTFFHIYGSQILKNMIEIEYIKDGYMISGLISKPETARGNRSYENFFLNGRYIKNSLLTSAVEDAYKGKLMQGRFPVFALNICVPVDGADVNVHPAKLEVRFSDEDYVYKIVYETVLRALTKEKLIPKIEKDTDENEVNIDDILDELKKKKFEDSKIRSHFLMNENDDEEAEKTDKIIKETVAELTDTVVENDNFSQSLHNEIKDIKFKQEEIEDTTKKSFFKNYRIIGQVFATYWLVEQEGSLYIIDQHAAHERILYEKILKNARAQKVASQKLLQGQSINLNYRQKEIVKENMEILNKMGYELEEIGDNFFIKAVPFIFQNPTDFSFFSELIDVLEEKGVENIFDLKLEKIASMSCKAAVKGNNRLSFLQAKEIIEKIVSLENPFNCPHGRPTIVEITKYEMEKMFKRIVN